MILKTLATDASHYLKQLSSPSFSVVIPAHNEEAVIGRCLTGILEGTHDGEVEIVVACNGCTDRTAEIAGKFGECVRVVETPTPSKIAALNLGDQTAQAFPRFYIDADIVVSIDSLRKTADELRTGRWLAASPAIDWDLSHSNWFVRAFYSVWRLQPYFDNGRLGAGLYAVNAAGHARIGEFPMITADDEFVRRKFMDSERVTVPDATFIVTPPRTLKDLIRIKTRSRRGTRELVQQFPELSRPASGGRWKLLARLAVRPWLWLAAPIYAFVVWMTWLRSRLSTADGTAVAWERDLSSRVVDPEA